MSEFEWEGKERARLDPGRARLLFLVDEDEVDLAFAVREVGGGVVLAPDEVQVHRAGGPVLRRPRVRRRRVLQDLWRRRGERCPFQTVCSFGFVFGSGGLAPLTIII